MSTHRFIKSIRDAGRGIRFVVTQEQNFRIQLVAGAVVIILMLVLRLTRYESIVILLLVFSVLALELLNSAFEHMSDILKPRLDLQVRVIKDMMAAAVLLSSLGAIIIGGIIFWPYVVQWLS